MSHMDLGFTLYIWSSTDHVEWEVICGFRLYACGTRTLSESECEGRVFALYIWSNADHVECRRSYTSGLGIGVE